MLRTSLPLAIPSRSGSRRMLLAGVSVIGLAAGGVVAACPASAASANGTTYQGPTTDGNWSNPNNWTAGVPGGTSSATVDNGQTVNTDGGNSASTLTVGATPGSAVAITDGTSLTVGNHIENAGTISLNSAGSTTELRTAGNGSTLTLSGGGTLTLSNNANNVIHDPATGNGQFVNVDNLIQGAGNIGAGQISLDNQAAGVISANQSTTLYLNLNGPGASNEGRLQAAAGGTLNVYSTAVTQTGAGTILSTGAGSVAQLTNSSVTGGTLATANGGVFATSGSNTLSGVTVANGSTFTASDGTVTNLVGTITNNGTLLLNSQGSTTDLRTLGNNSVVTLTGGGVVQLSNNANNVIRDAYSGNGQLVNVNNTIQGSGNIGYNQLSLDNQAGGTITASQSTPLIISTNGAGATNEGLLQAAGGTLNIAGTTVTQSGSGNLLATGAGSVVQLTNSTVNGGTLTTSGGGAFATSGNNTLGNVTIAPASTVTTSDSSVTNLVGTITNKGTLLLNSQGSTTELRTLGNNSVVTLTGGGVVQLSNSANNLIRDAYNGNGQLVNVNNTIQGSGNIGNNQLSLDNQAGGTITASQSTPLYINTNGAGATNEGLLQAAGGTLNVLGTTVTQTGGGTILATGPNSTVQLINSAVSGGTLTNTAGGAFATAGDNTLTNVTVSSGSTFTTSDNSLTTLVGTITNRGTLALGSGGSATEYRIAGGQTLTLTGGGTVALSNNSNNYIRDATSANGTLVNVDNTIQGSGQFGNAQLGFQNQAAGTVNANQSAALVLNANLGASNAGLMEATGPGTLQIVNTGVTQTGNGAIAANGGTVTLTNSSVTGGTVASTGGGTLQSTGGNNNLTNVTITGGSTYHIADNSITYVNGTITNNGTIAVDSGGSTTELRITPGATTTLTGGGVVQLSANGANYIRDGVNGTGTLVNVNNTIQGAGQLGNAQLGLDNQAAGTIAANLSGTTLNLQTNGAGFSNEGAVLASNGGTLQIINTGVTQTGGGAIQATGGTVRFSNSSVTGGMIGNDATGTLTSVGGNNNLTDLAITAHSTYHITDNTTTTINGTITNNGTIALDSGGSTTELRITPGATTTLTGGGVVQLSANGANYIRDGVNSTGTLVNVNNTIQGAGNVGNGQLGLDNQAGGTVTANIAATTLTLQGNGYNPGSSSVTAVHNAGALSAANGGTLDIRGTVNQDAGGTTTAGTGSTVVIDAATINGGTLATGGTGVMRTAGTSALNNVTIATGSTVTGSDNTNTYLGGTITNRGTLALSSGGNTTEFRVNGGATTTLTGGGTVTLSNNGANYIRDADNSTGTLVNQDNTIQGAGQFGNGQLGVVNKGTILANDSTALTLNTNIQGLNNTGTLQASSGASLNVQGGALANYAGGTLTGGTYHADAGSTINLNTAGITTNAATIVLNGTGSAINTQAGAIETTLATNAQGGSLQILGGRNYATAQDLGNSGAIQLGGGTLAPGSLTNTTTGTVTGFGTVAPSNGTPLANAGIVTADSGTLTLATGIAGAGTLQVNAGATASLAGAPAGNTVGVLAQNGTLATAGNNVTVSSDYTNAYFGTGNGFNKTAGVTGGGQVLASGDVAQAITGAKVQNGTTATPTLALGDFHTTDAAHATGGTSASFAVANTGTTGPALRGAIQNTGITDPRLSGSGVTAGNFGPVATGSQTGPYTVNVAPSAAGALVNQSIHVANNFANVAEQTVAITGTGYNYAQATIANGQPISLGNVRVGDTASTTLAIGNTAPAGAFTEKLDGAAAGTTGNATVSGSFTGLSAGSSSNAISVGLNTSSAGAKSGTATVGFTSNAAGVDSLGNSALGSQTVQVQGAAFRLATGSAATPVSAGNVHVGDTAQATLAITNTAAADGFSEKLNAAVGGVGGNVASTSGSVALLNAGATSNAVTARLDTSSAGAKSGTVSLNYASDGTGTTGHAASANGTGTVTVTGNVYNLASSSTIGNVNFGVLHTNTGTQTRALSVSNTAAPGGFSEGLDTSFGAYTNNGTVAVSASGAITNLAAGATDASSLQLSVSTAQAGTVSGTIQVHQASNGTISGLGNTALPDQNPAVSGTVEATVTNLAQAQINTAQPVAFGNVRIGSTQAAALSITNAAPAGGFSESLVANTAGGGAGTTGGVTLAGGFGNGSGTAVPSLAPQATDTTHVIVGLNTASAGTKSGNATIDFKSDGTAFNGGTVTDVGTQNIAVTGNVYRLANPTVNTPAVTLAARVGGTASAALSLSNTSPDVYTEGLKASVAAAPANFTSAGTINNLAAGGTDSSSLRVGLVTSTSGTFTGNQAVTLASTGAGTTGATDQALGSSNVALTGRVYQTASAAVTPNPVNFGTVHIGDVVAPRSLSVGNTATGALTDVLRGGFGAVSGPFSGTGTLGDGVAAGSSSTALQVGLNTSSAGVFSGSAGLALTSHDGDLLDVGVAASPVSLQGTVNNYAVSGFGRSSGAGLFSGVTNSYTLDFGMVAMGASLMDSLFAANVAAGPADALAGSYSNRGSGFALSGFNSFSGLLPGMQSDGLSVTFDTSQAGTFKEVIDLMGIGSNDSGYSGAVADTLLTVEGTVMASNTQVPEPGSLALLGSGIVALLGLGRRRTRLG